MCYALNSARGGEEILEKPRLVLLAVVRGRNGGPASFMALLRHILHVCLPRKLGQNPLH